MALAPARPAPRFANLLGRFAQWPLALGFLVLVVIGGVSIWLVRSAAEQNDWVEHSYEVRAASGQLLSALLQAESAQRGFVLVGGDIYLRTYREGMAQIEPALAQLERLTADNPEQHRRVRELKPLVEARVVELDRVRAFAEAGRAFDALAAIRTNRGKHLMDPIRQRIDAFRAIEQRLLEARARAAEAGMRLLLGATLAGLAAIVLLAFVAYRSAQRYTRALLATTEELSVLNTDLEGRVAVRTAELSAANEEIQRYAYIVSHDLRAPLVNIMGFTSELRAVSGDIADFHAAAVEKLPELNTPAARAAIEEDLPEAIGFISASTGKMDRLINAILKISREGGRVLTPERIDMTALVEEAAQGVAHQAGDAVIEVAPLPSIVSDRLAMEQIFGNLVENAIKYLQPGRPGVIRVTGIERRGEIEYAISDNGRGIDAGDHERVFDLFRRSGRQDRQGEGIGLAHVRALVRRLGGTIALASVFGEGSTFTVTLPTALAKEERRR